jgi:hypothetical protein
MVNEMNSVPCGDIGGVSVYNVYHPSSRQYIYVTLEDIYR